MAKSTNQAKANPETFLTHDWRQLNVNNVGSTVLINDEMMDEKNGIGEMNALRSLAQDVSLLKQDNHAIRNCMFEMEKDRDNLRTAIRKLKVENSRIKAKLKRVGDVVKSHSGVDTMDIDNLDNEVDYEDLRGFLLVGGPKDPFALQYNDAPLEDIKDPDRVQHKTCERYYWYKMAEFFEDEDAKKKILTAEDNRKAEEIVKEVKNFDQAKWDGVKLKYFEEAQRLKFDQHRWIRNLLVKSGSTYIAVASQDKTIGTGWRKQREEASRTQLWDGENNGGKVLMKLRDEYSQSHSWADAKEEQDALSKFNEFKRSIWKPYGAGARMGGGIGRGGSVRQGVARMSVNAMPAFPPPQFQQASRPVGAAKTVPKKRRQI